MWGQTMGSLIINDNLSKNATLEIIYITRGNYFN